MIGAASCLGAPVAAQEMLHAPDAIRACLCDEQAIETLARTVTDDRRAYQSAANDLQSATSQADAARGKLDPNDAAAREALGRLLDQRDMAQDRLARAAGPLGPAVARYNATVASFNTDCARKSYDPAVLPDVRANLACPPVALAPPS